MADLSNAHLIAAAARQLMREHNRYKGEITGDITPEFEGLWQAFCGAVDGMVHTRWPDIGLMPAHIRERMLTIMDELEIKFKLEAEAERKKAIFKKLREITAPYSVLPKTGPVGELTAKALADRAAAETEATAISTPVLVSGKSNSKAFGVNPGVTTAKSTGPIKIR